MPFVPAYLSFAAINEKNVRRFMLTLLQAFVAPGNCLIDSCVIVSARNAFEIDFHIELLNRIL